MTAKDSGLNEVEPAADNEGYVNRKEVVSSEGNEQQIAGSAGGKDITAKVLEEIEADRRVLAGNVSSTGGDLQGELYFGDLYFGPDNDGAASGGDPAPQPGHVLESEPKLALSGPGPVAGEPGLDPGATDSGEPGADLPPAPGEPEDNPEQNPEPIHHHAEPAPEPCGQPEQAKDPWDGKDWKESINPEGVDQVPYGDCFFEASLASLANTEKGREKIHNMVALNEDGTYTVRFPGDANSPINVSAADLKKWNLGNPSTWANVIEAAFLEHNESLNPLRNIGEKYGVAPFANVTNPREAAKLLTGDDVITDQFAVTDLGSQQLTLGWTSKENVRRDLAWAMDNQSVVTAGSSFGISKFVGGHTSDTLVNGHAYSVVGFDKDNDTVIVRNPWASNPCPLENPGDTANGITSLGDGKLSMSLDTFMKNFSDMTVSGRSNVSTTAEHLVNTRTDVGNHGFGVFKSLIHGDLSGAKDNGKSFVKDLAAVPSESLHGTTTTGYEYFKHVLGHPEQSLIPIPGVPAVTFITDQIIKNIASTSPEQGE